MATCRRVPAHPLAQADALVRETVESLSTEPLTPEILDTLYCTMASVRREIHANPEPGFEEHKTQALLRRLLVEMARIPDDAIRACAGTGLVVDLRGAGPPTGGASDGHVKVVALRADMDALRMTEGANGLPYRSRTEGVAHLCGHDGHMASLLGAATLLRQRAHKIPSDCTIRLLWQPAEEGPGGAMPMIAEGCLEGVDEAYGYHNWPAFAYGTLVVQPGPVMAHPTTVTITVTGKGGHGSQPHVAVDPVLCAAHIIVALQSVVSRNVPSKEQCILSITMVHGGEVFNVIPDQVTLKGTIRDLSPDVCELIYARVRAIVAGTCAAFGASASVEFDDMYPCIVNHEPQTAIVTELGRQLLGGDAKVTSEGLPMMGAEDFSYFLQRVPGCFFFLGSKEPDLQAWSRTAGGAGARSNCMCHNTQFDFNDNISPLAAVFWVRLIEHRLGVRVYSDAELPMPLLDEPAGGGGDGAPPAPTGPIVLPGARKKFRTK